MNAVAQISKAKKALAAAKTLDDVLAIKDQAEVVRALRKARGDSLDAQNDAAYIRLLAERKLGEFLKEMPKNGGGRPAEKTCDTVSQVSLGDIGISRKQSERFQKTASVSENEFEDWIEGCREEQREITTAELHRIADHGKILVSKHRNGNDERYTPAHLVELVRKTLGTIDLDPASCELAQQTVQAERFFTEDDDGLAQKWSGRVFLNPPYSTPLISQFVDKLIESKFREAILLTNNSTDTGWWHQAANNSAAICFLKDRIHFSTIDGTADRPTNGQCLFYFGNCAAKFTALFSECGYIAERRLTPDRP